MTGHYAPRIYSGGGTAVQVGKLPADGLMGGIVGSGVFSGVEPATGAIILCPIIVHDGAGSTNARGRMRGAFGVRTPNHHVRRRRPTIVGSGAYTGRTFLVIKSVNGGSTLTSLFCMDITGPWETN